MDLTETEQMKNNLYTALFFFKQNLLWLKVKTTVGRRISFIKYRMKKAKHLAETEQMKNNLYTALYFFKQNLLWLKVKTTVGRRIILLCIQITAFYSFMH